MTHSSCLCKGKHVLTEHFNIFSYLNTGLGQLCIECLLTVEFLFVFCLSGQVCLNKQPFPQKRCHVSVLSVFSALTKCPTIHSALKLRISHRISICTIYCYCHTGLFYIVLDVLVCVSVLVPRVAGAA